jgi:DNA-binding SARP family transcriptional activator
MYTVEPVGSELRHVKDVLNKKHRRDRRSRTTLNHPAHDDGTSVAHRGRPPTSFGRRAIRRRRVEMTCAPRKGPQLALLGGFDLRVDGQIVALPMAAQRVLAFLALHERPLLRGYVAGSLWPESEERRAAGSLRSALFKLGHPGYALVELTSGHIELSQEMSVDVRDSIALCHRLLNNSRAFVPDDDADVRLSADVLPDWSDDWLIVEREHLRQLRLHALEALSERFTALGRFPQAIESGLAAVAAEPLRESAHRALIKAHVAEGNPGEAARQYRLFRQLLHDELGAEPSGAMEDLVRRLRPLTIG